MTEVNGDRSTKEGEASAATLALQKQVEMLAEGFASMMDSQKILMSQIGKKEGF